MTSFIDWFKTDGDKIFTFVSLASLALPSIAGISPQALQAALISGVLATAAHQSFFPNVPQGRLT